MKLRRSTGLALLFGALVTAPSASAQDADGVNAWLIQTKPETWRACPTKTFRIGPNGPITLSDVFPPPLDPLNKMRCYQTSRPGLGSPTVIQFVTNLSAPCKFKTNFVGEQAKTCSIDVLRVCSKLYVPGTVGPCNAEVGGNRCVVCSHAEQPI